MTDGSVRMDDPLQHAWRVAMRWRVLACQFAGTFIVLAVAALGCRIALSIAPEAGVATGQVIVWAVSVFLAWLLLIETTAAVMGRAWAEYTSNKAFHTWPYLLRTSLPTLIVGSAGIGIVVILSIFPHLVLLLLTGTGWLGRVIFGLALIPMFIIALIEVMLLLAVAFVFPPMLVEGRIGPAGAVQSFIDAAVGCRPRDVGVRFRAFVTAVLIALPVLTVGGLAAAYLMGLAGVANFDYSAICDSGEWMPRWLVGISGLAIISALAAAPLAYLNVACLMVHRATQE